MIADVLYLLPEAQQRALLVGAAAATRPGGVVVVKEMGLQPTWKFGWNRAQETLATRVFGVTDSIGHGMTFVAPDTMADWLRGGLDVVHRRVDMATPGRIT